MGASLHVSLPDEMRRYVDLVANGAARYATPSEYVRDLIRKDMERMEVYEHILQGVEEADRGEFVPQAEVEAFFAQFAAPDKA